VASGSHVRKRRRLSVRGAFISAAAVAVVGGVLGLAGATYASNHGHHSQSLDSPGPPPPTTVPSVPLTLISASPASGATDVASNTVISLHFSAPLAPADADPVITPPLAGSWATSGSTMTFTPEGGWFPYSAVKVTLPAGLAGGAGTHTTPLAAPVSTTFTIAPGSTLRLQQLLAELGYLPLTFTPAGAAPGQPAVDTNSTVASEVSPLPVAGTFTWRFPNTPYSLRSQWAQGEDNVVDRGAIMAFESNEGLATDGVAGPQVWRALLTAAAQRQVSKQPYNYLMVSENLPETLQVWSDGSIIASSLANTGIPEAPTALGTYPVYARYASTTMSGYNPDGSYYSDPGVLWVAYFNGGDAVHQFPRPGYGYPQSLGCVELPSTTAETIWGMDPIGTLVTVS
jgi:peptidoglycan hydrolase-like protein with peptidoglycan-binding domain